MDPGAGLPVEDMVDYMEDLWQGLNAFWTPKITEIPSPETVQNSLENLPAGNGARVSDSPPFAKEGLLEQYIARPLNPLLGGAPYSLFSTGQTLHGSDAVITHSVSFQATPHQRSPQPDGDLHRRLDSFLEQLASTGE